MTNEDMQNEIYSILNQYGIEVILFTNTKPSSLSENRKEVEEFQSNLLKKYTNKILQITKNFGVIKNE